MTENHPSHDKLSLAQRLYQGDPILVWLRDKRRISYPLWVVVIALLGFALLALLPPLVGVPKDPRGLAISTIQGFIIMPFGFCIYLLIPDFIAGLFNSLDNGGVIGEPRQEGDSDYPTFINRLVASANKRLWVVLTLILISLYCYYRLWIHIENDATRDIPIQYRQGVRIVYLLFYSPLIYGGLLSIARFLVGLTYSHRLFRHFKLKINPLNPDGAGGLSRVGRMLIISVIVAVLLGAASAGMIIFNIALGQNPLTRSETIAFGVVYLILTPLLFFVWLWTPHQALLDARQEALQPFAEEYLNTVNQSIPNPNDSAEDIKNKTERLVEVKRQYEMVRDAFPTWPLPDQTLKRLVAASSSQLYHLCSAGWWFAWVSIFCNWLNRNKL